MKTRVPPIKSQGIKTKLVPWISGVAPAQHGGLWIEPFMGTGVVAFNIAPDNALLCDANPHLINFYQSVASGEITPQTVKNHLEKEGASLLSKGEAHYYAVRKRFNRDHRPLDFLFLNRAGFNGLIRFNQKGEINTPFCRKPQRFAPAYVTKIFNQVAHISQLLRDKNFVFKCQDFEKTIAESGRADILYCDPPYIARHADYYGGWNESHEHALHKSLANAPCKFILSTWHHNEHRENPYIKTLWNKFNILTRNHFYHVGGSENNRGTMVEALVTNYTPPANPPPAENLEKQLTLFESRPVAA